MPKRLIISAFLLVGFLLAVRAVMAQEAVATPSDNDVNRVAKQMFCPVCENVPLDVCPTQACAQWRATIREKLQAGWSDQQIKDYFVAQYGERVLAQPSTRGINWLVWVIPPIVIVVGAFFLWRVLRQMSAAGPAGRVNAPAPNGGSSAPAGGAPTVPDEYVARLEDELKQRR
jgi:cytochrome c-type biogenesis protein CcmH